MPNAIHSLLTHQFSQLLLGFFFLNTEKKLKYFFVNAYFAANLMKHMDCTSLTSMQGK